MTKRTIPNWRRWRMNHHQQGSMVEKIRCFQEMYNLRPKRFRKLQELINENRWREVLEELSPFTQRPRRPFR